MGTNGLDEYWVPEHVKDYLRKLGFVLLLDDMEPWIRGRDDWMSARGEFYDYRDKDGMGRVYAKGVLLAELAKLSKINRYGITLVSLDESFCEEMEPGPHRWLTDSPRLRRLAMRVAGRG